MKSFLVLLSLLLSLLFGPATGLAQPDTTWLKVHPLLGGTLTGDQSRALKLQSLLPVKGFTQVCFFTLADGASIKLKGTGPQSQLILGSLQERKWKAIKSKVSQQLGETLNQLSQVTDSLEAGISLEVIISTYRGETMRGWVVKAAEKQLSIDHELGMLSVSYASIKELAIMTEEESVLRTQYGYANPQPTRYVFAPSAIPLKKGEGYYQNFFLSLNSAYVGVTDHLTIGGGLELISTLTGWPMVFGTMKVGTQVAEKVHVGGGVIAGGMISEYGFGVAAPFGSVTLGTPEHQLTLNMGYGISLSDAAEGNVLAVLAGSTRMSRRLALVTESWLAPGPGATILIPSLGLRVMGKDFALDIGLFNYVGWYSDENYHTGRTEGYVDSGFSDGIPGLPYLGATVNF
jgi:hypothetical protein